MRSEIRFWEIDLSLLTNSLVATRFRILFTTITQELSTVEQKRKPSQAAAAGKSKKEQKEQRDASLANKYTITTAFIFRSIVGKPKQI